MSPEWWSVLDRPITAQRWQPIPMWCYHAHHHRWFDLCLCVLDDFRRRWWVLWHQSLILLGYWLLIDPVSRHATCGPSTACGGQQPKQFDFNTLRNFRMKTCVCSDMSCLAIWTWTRNKPMEVPKIWWGAKRWEATSTWKSRGDRMGCCLKRFNFF